MPAALILVALASSAGAQKAPTLPGTTLSCADFKKNGDGTWTAVKDTSFMFAGFQVKMNLETKVTDTSFFYDNNRLIDTLNAKCGS